MQRQPSRATRVRPLSGGRRKLHSSFGNETLVRSESVNVDATNEEDVQTVKRRWMDVDDRRSKELENYQRANRSFSDCGNNKVFMDFTIGDRPAGRIVIELLDDVVEKTAENFKLLCTGAGGYDCTTSIKLDYVDSIVHRVIPGLMIALGELQGVSLSALQVPVADERFTLRHTTRGLLSMISRGPNNNGSAFIITLGPAPQLDYKQVVFGKVIDGLSVLSAIEQVELSRTGVPKVVVSVTFCGALTGTKQVAVDLKGGNLVQICVSPVDESEQRVHLVGGTDAKDDSILDPVLAGSLWSASAVDQM